MIIYSHCRLIVAVLLLLCSRYVIASPDWQFYNDLLHDHLQLRVQQSGITFTAVNYAAWEQDSRHLQAMKILKETDPASLNTAQRLAYWINAYNLLTIDLIIREQEQESIKNLGSWLISPWKKFSWELYDGAVTLDKIEHDILRKIGPPEIHMAIVCASLSCPDLRTEAYTGERIEEQLAEQTYDFLQNPRKGMDFDGTILKISKIFRWFKEDFAVSGGVLTFIRQYTTLPDNARISEFLPYDWKLNSIP